MPIPSASKPIRILAVVVLYKMAPEDSPTLRTLLEARIEPSTPGLFELGIVVQDNTPGRNDAGRLNFTAHHISAPHNPGLSSAYNGAVAIAEREGYDWLLTLDQDTDLPRNFLAGIAHHIKAVDSSPEVAAIVPQIVSDGRAISPFRFLFNAIPRWFRDPVPAVLETATYAVNSASTLRVAALREVGGYDLMFPLDISDISLFHRLTLARKKVFFAADLVVSHNFSMLGKESRMSLERYRSLLLDECAFWDAQMTLPARAERMVRLAGRACKETMQPEGRAFREITLGELKRRLTTRRSQRLAQWREFAEERLARSR